ncbi:hypothetical protein [Streptomyces sp. NPDC095613]|uniref:hypothetical protein n=1 Tax=Streptomyces sp. NPDC095613 TaxID=3155540 RepID=UPI0033289F0E
MTPTPKTRTTEPETTEATADTTKAGTEATAPETGSAEAKETTSEESEDTAAARPAAKDATAGDPAAGDSATADDAATEHPDQDDEDDDVSAGHRPSGVAAAAAAVISAALGIVALTGTWTSRVIGERTTLVGQLTTGQTAGPEEQISALYGDAWHATAAVNGVVALIALLVGVVVMTLPRRTDWARPVAVAGAILGLLGLLVSFGMYFDLLVPLPTPGT